MRILFDQAAHDMRNKGNNALLRSAIDRFRQVWPDAECGVITVAPHLARLYFPDIQPVHPNTLCEVKGRLGRVHDAIPAFMLRLLLEAREGIWHRRTMLRQTTPQALKAEADHALEVNGNATVVLDEQTKDMEEPAYLARHDNYFRVVGAMTNYDLYVASGGGYFCDHDRQALLDMFERMEAAIALGIPVVMVGQGIGPLTDSNLLARSREIVANIEHINYRNDRLGRAILETLGVPAERMSMTGDDAIEMAYLARSETDRNGIGASIRLSDYTAVDSHYLERLRPVLQGFAQEHDAELIAVPISSAHHESDSTHANELLRGYDRTATCRTKLESWTDAIARTGRCRLMVSGTYHGAIFALGQGIPVIGIAGSVEYFEKLAELTDEFGQACTVLLLDSERFEDELMEALRFAWSSANFLRPGILDQVRQQIQWQHTAYEHICANLATRQSHHVDCELRANV